MVFASGVGIAMQAPINNALGQQIGSNLFAALVSFGVGFSVLIILNIATANISAVRALPNASIWMFAGGLFGAFAVYSSLTNVVKLGALTMVATIVLGQLLAAMVIDAIGFGNLNIKEISLPRILAVVMIAAGIVLSRY
jgi:transporter family-2 protein